MIFDRIVVGYTGDEAGRDALTLAAELAVGFGGRITVVFPYHPLLSREDSELAEQRVRQEIDEVLAVVEGTSQLEAPTVHWSPSSWPIRALHELACYEQADLIVFAISGHGLAEKLQISLMERMVHGAPCAVALAPTAYADRSSRRLSRIGVGFSSSEEGRAAMTLAGQLAESLGAHVEVIAGAGVEPALPIHGFGGPSLSQSEEHIYSEIERTLERTCRELSDNGSGTMSQVILRGEPARVLIDRSRELDLLILGSRAYGPLRHALLGSVSAQVMRNAHCPIMVLPRGRTGSDERAEEPGAATARQR